MKMNLWLFALTVRSLYCIYCTQELESQLQVFETVMQRDISECVTDMETTFQSSEVDLSGKGGTVQYSILRIITFFSIG